MWNDVLDLRDFYATGTGLMARRLIRGKLRAMWSKVNGERVLGFGYPVPYLGLYQGEAERVIALMPPEQGVLHWPVEGPNAVALSDEVHLPLPDRSIDRVLLVHAVESSEALRALLREVWRILADGGRLLVVAPNRRSLWARSDRTPFGHGRPFTLAQITRLLRDSMFSPVASSAALVLPPFRSRLLLAWAPAWDRFGAKWLAAIAGVVLIEATKTIYAAQAVPARARRRVLPISALRPARSAATGAPETAPAAPIDPMSNGER
jgi:SAM-dependent methyltransferase